MDKNTEHLLKLTEDCLIDALDRIDGAMHFMRQLQTKTDMKHHQKMSECKETIKQALNQSYDELARKRAK